MLKKSVKEFNSWNLKSEKDWNKLLTKIAKEKNSKNTNIENLSKSVKEFIAENSIETGADSSSIDFVNRKLKSKLWDRNLEKNEKEEKAEENEKNLQREILKFSLKNL